MALAWSNDAERLESFATEIDALKKRAESEITQADFNYIRRLDWFSRGMEVVGRGLIHVGFDPLTLGTGVFALWIHKQLQATEIGHTALHGAFNRFENAGRFHSRKHRWQTPIDEASWDRGHNKMHHTFTNIAGKDPDVHYGPSALTTHARDKQRLRISFPVTLLAVIPNFAFWMNVHFSGMHDFYFGNGSHDKFDFIKERSKETFVETHKRAFRKYVPYYLKEYGLFPLLAGPMWWKVALCNLATEVMRDIYSAVTIFCGHVGADTKSYARGTVAKSRGERYAMQVEASNNYEVPRVVSVLCGALDRQIEHHLFPSFPTTALRRVAPEVRRICEEHGIEYRTESWPSRIRKAFGHIRELSRVSGGSAQLVEALK